MSALLHNYFQHRIRIKHLILLSVFVLFSGNCAVYAQIPNAGFENWSNDVDGNLNPDFWITTNNAPDDTSVFRYSPAISGNYSMRVTTYTINSIVLPGIAYSEFPFSCRPDKIRFCIKTNVISGDIGYVMMALRNGDSTIAAMDSCTFKFYGSENSCFEFPVKYISTLNPDTAIIMVIAGDLAHPVAGTEIIVDDISFNNCNLSAGEFNLSPIGREIKSYPNPVSDFISIPFSLLNNSAIFINIYDFSGNEILTYSNGYTIAGNHVIKLPVYGLPKGMFFFTIKGNRNDILYTGKFIITG